MAAPAWPPSFPLSWSLRRLREALLALAGASVLIFLVVPMAPGDPAAFALRAQGGNYSPSAEQLAAKRHELGLDRPLLSQYAGWIGGALQGDLGNSYRSGRPVTELVAERIGATLRLAAMAALIAIPTAIGLALLCVAFVNRVADHAIRILCAVIASVPAFVLALLAADIFAVRLGWFSALGDGSWLDAILPAACLGLPLGSWWAQLLRVHMLEAHGSDYHLVAMARGSSPLRALLIHTLPNGLVPFLNLMGIGISFLFAGTAVVEAVFNWPGLGTLLLRAVGDRDLAVVQALALLGTMVFTAVGLIVDGISRWVDPRLQTVAP